MGSVVYEGTDGGTMWIGLPESYPRNPYRSHAWAMELNIHITHTHTHIYIHKTGARRYWFVAYIDV